MKVLMHALAASCEELRATTGNPPLELLTCSLASSSLAASATNGLLTEREVCTVKYQTDVF
jgi:hypothetical protein